MQPISGESSNGQRGRIVLRSHATAATYVSVASANAVQVRARVVALLGELLTKSKGDLAANEIALPPSRSFPDPPAVTSARDRDAEPG